MFLVLVQQHWQADLERFLAFGVQQHSLPDLNTVFPQAKYIDLSIFNIKVSIHSFYKFISARRWNSEVGHHLLLCLNHVLKVLLHALPDQHRHFLTARRQELSNHSEPAHFILKDSYHF